jgi:hypothetical protein
MRNLHTLELRGTVKRFKEFCYIAVLLHHEFVPPGDSVTGHFYVQVLQRLRDTVLSKRSYKWQGQWFLHHGNEPSHTSLVVQRFLAEENIPVFTQPPYFLSHAPTDFWLFPIRKMGFKWDTFRTIMLNK